MRLPRGATARWRPDPDRRPASRLPALLFALVLCAVPAASAADDLRDDFSIVSNPNGHWSYGWSASPGSMLHLYTHPYPNDGDGFEHWETGIPAIMHNVSLIDQHPAGTTTVPPNDVCTHPGWSGVHGVVRWTAPATTVANVSATFVGRSGWNNAPLTTTAGHVVHNGTVLFSCLLNQNGAGNEAGWQGSRAVQAGDSLDFAVGDGGNGNYYDTTGLIITVTYEGAGVTPDAAPSRVALRAGPNPARGPVVFTLQLPRRGQASLQILDLSGRRVRDLFQGACGAGTVGTTWDGLDASGRRVPSGVYFAVLTVDGGAAATRFVIAR
jgi:hypothetical protein